MSAKIRGRFGEKRQANKSHPGQEVSRLRKLLGTSHGYVQVQHMAEKAGFKSAEAYFEARCQHRNISQKGKGGIGVSLG